MVKVSVVIPTYNRLERLKRVLNGLVAQTYPHQDFEVVIVSDGSTDGTEEYLHQLVLPFPTKIINQINQGVAIARNNGVAQAEGNVVLFVDDDVVPTPQLITEHMRWQEDNNYSAVVIGPMLTPPDHKMSPWVAWEQEKLARQYQDMLVGKWQATARQFYTGNTSLARQFLLETGGFDPDYKRAEDVELAYRLSNRGVQFLFNPQAIGHHYAERSFESWIAIAYAYGRNDVLFTHQKGQVWLLPQIYAEFNTRHALVKGLTKTCLDRPQLTALVTNILKGVAEFASAIHAPVLASQACSGLFNLRYYQGIADELDGRDAFFEGLKERRLSYAN